MSTLGITSYGIEQPTRVGFWRRQFSAGATISQLVFDVVFGIIAPILCFAFDPIVFRNGLGGGPFFAQYQVLVYLFSGLEILTLVPWLLLREELPAKRLIGGVLLVGGIFCAAIGCILLPFSLIGLLFYFIGAFGFIPFLTAIVYLRNGCGAYRAELPKATGMAQAAPILLGCLLAIGVPVLLSGSLHEVVSHSVDEVIQGDSQHATEASQRLKWLSVLSGAELDRIVNVYNTESKPARKQQLKHFYQEITGDEIEHRLRVVQD